jgi:hypothetical protein
MCISLLGACASDSGERTTRDEAPRCPAAHTLTCEAKSTGRIHHGTFRKDYDRCACVPEGRGSLDSPVIPVIR